MIIAWRILLPEDNMGQECGIAALLDIRGGFRMRSKQQIKAFIAGTLYFIMIPAATYLIFVCLRPASFLNYNSIRLIFEQSIYVCILAWGMIFSMKAGDNDLSLGAERILGCIIGILIAKEIKSFVGIPIGCIGVGIIVGGLKAFTNSAIKMTSIIFRIAYTLILSSAGAIIAGNKSLTLSSKYTILGKAPWCYVIFIVLGITLLVVEKYSVFSAHCKVLSGNEKLAKDSGISKEKTTAIAIMISSAYCAISGVIACSFGAGTASSTGLDSFKLVFPAMIAVHVGFALEKHINIVFGVFAGVMITNTISTGLISLGLASELKDTFMGFFLICLMITSVVTARHSEERARREVKAAGKKNIVNT